MFTRNLLAIVALGTALVGTAPAQSDSPVRVTAEAEPMEVTPGNLVTFTIRVEGVPATVVRPPDRPPVPNLKPRRSAPRAQRGSSTGTSSKRYVAFTWRYQARQTGEARIPPVDVVVRGETYTTAGIQVRVVSQSTPSTSVAGGESQVIDPQDLLIRAVATADRAYQNEQVIVGYRLFYRPDVRLRHSRLADAWDAPGFWREELDVPSRPTPRTQRINGRTYKTIVLKRVALFPTRPGSLRVDPLRIEAEAQGTLQRRGATVRGHFEPVRLASEALSLSVRSLPSTAPPSFDGAVGRFSISMEADRDSVAVGDPVQLTVRAQGIGNLATLSPPDLDAPSAFEVYDPTTQTNVDRGKRRIGGTKTFTYTLVPQSSGRYSLSPVTFSYFDPDTEQYRTVRASPPTLRVTGESAPRVVGRTGDGLPVGTITDPIAAAEAQWARTDRRPLYRWPWAYVALLLPVLAAGGAVMYRRWARVAETADAAGPDGGRDAVQRHVRAARRHLRDEEMTAFYETVERALLAFLDERLPMDGASTTRAALDRSLTHHDVPEDLQNALFDLLDDCEDAQFAPERASSDDSAKAVFEKTQAVLRQLDNTLPEAVETSPRP